MIGSVATFSLDQARKHFEAQYVFPGERRAWIGFDTCFDDRSPLHEFNDGSALIVRCHDWDVDGRHSPAQAGPAKIKNVPSLDFARRIVAFVLALHRADERYALAVHCQGGLFRSGAVAEWVRSDLGVAEHECSNRNVDVIGDTAEQRIYNIALLRLLREAHAEAIASDRATLEAP